MSFRTYHQVAGDDRSRLGEQVAAQQRRVRERLAAIGRVAAVTSGKGGVGKSYVTAALAAALAPRLPHGVGVLDADLTSPTTAGMLGAHGPLRVDPSGVHPATGRGDTKVMSMDLMLAEGAPLAWKEPGSDRFLWRGILETGALREFLADVAWGPLDLLLIDMPPGSDRLHDLAGLVPELAGALVVTLPGEESRRSVERAMCAAAEARVRLLGVVENMSGYRCAGCGETRPLFTGDAGELLAARFGTPLLARLPFSPRAAPADPLPAHEALAGAFLEVLR